MITGQIMVRKTGAVVDGREVVMVFGCIAAPKGEEIRLDGEHQYLVTGIQGGGHVTLNMHEGYAMDRTDEGRGLTPSQILVLPIWQV